MEMLKMIIEKCTFGCVLDFVILCAVILISEVGTVKYGGDTGALLWTTFHFVVNPILCSIYIIMTVFNGIYSKGSHRLICLFGIALAGCYIYISVTGNTNWVEIFGIDFNK